MSNGNTQDVGFFDFFPGEFAWRSALHCHSTLSRGVGAAPPAVRMGGARWDNRSRRFKRPSPNTTSSSSERRGDCYLPGSWPFYRNWRPCFEPRVYQTRRTGRPAVEPDSLFRIRDCSRFLLARPFLRTLRAADRAMGSRRISSARYCPRWPLFAQRTGTAHQQTSRTAFLSLTARG